ncbi:MAG TPA: ABC transporter ATP-binding protein [Chloroflexota bacterium]|nr:ABC transporter ATP-binding protein [Chloroflexota bacterium]
MTQVIELTQVSKVYNGGAAQTALDGISMSVASGEFVAVMGPSGSGKSTLLNMVAGLDRPTSGRVCVGGRDLTGLSEGELAKFRRTHVGIVFQFFHLLNDLTVLDNVLVAAELAGIKRSAARQQATALLARLEIADKADVYPAELSGGQRQRVAIARALVNRPPLLLADEPTGALDSRSGDQIMELIAAINASGQTVVLVTHDAKLAARHAQRVISMSDGRIVDDAVLEPAAGTRSLLTFQREEARR